MLERFKRRRRLLLKQIARWAIIFLAVLGYALFLTAFNHI